MTAARAWWKEAVVYQIYPQSFNDSDGDGVGDLQGIIERLDYVADLGVDVIWLNPVYQSPQVDNGYDISDYRAIHDEYGTLEDWEELLNEIHARDMKLVMDLVVNHTSDDHEWFERSRRDEDGYRDYYIWREGDTDEDGEPTPPNNWTSGFGGSAWTYDEHVGAQYLHLFHERQPDLNWENPDVRSDIYEMIDWWLAKGIDGFRMDVINLLSKPEGLPDGDPDSEWIGIEHFADGPRTQEFLEEMAAETFDEYDSMTVGECVNIDVDTAGDYVSADGPLDMVFHFEHMQLDKQEGWWAIEDWSLPDLKSVMAEWQTDLDGWNTVYLGNHDQPRIVSRFGDDGEYREESATLLATFLLTHQGTPFLFQGDEIGMTNCPWESAKELRDADASNRVRLALESGDINEYDEARDVVEFRSRDNARTPMQWDASENAGFTDGDPWIKINPNYEDINVAAAEAAEDGILSYYRDLIDLRSDLDVLVYGEYELLLPDHETVYAYRRTLEDPVADVDDVLVVLNVSPTATHVSVPVEAEAVLLFGNELDAATESGGHDVADLDLQPYEARLYELSQVQ